MIGVISGAENSVGTLTIGRVTNEEVRNCERSHGASVKDDEQYEALRKEGVVCVLRSAS